MKNLFILFILAFGCLNSYAQLEVYPPITAGGDHTLVTSGPGNSRFYLFDDGCFKHSASSTTRNYQGPSIYTPSVFLLVPYDNNPPSRFSKGTSQVNTSTYSMLNYSMPSNPHVSTSWDPSNKSYTYFILKINHEEARNQKVTFYYNSADVFIDGSVIDTYNNWFGAKDTLSNTHPQFDKQITWTINFQGSSKVLAYIPLKCRKGPGHSFNIASKYNGNNIVIQNFVQQGTPHDPNSVHADRECIARTEEEMILNGRPVTVIKNKYHIEFQNEGNAPAQNVQVVFNLPNMPGIKLDPNTATIVDSEYPHTLEVTPSGRVIVKFNGINLPGLQQTYPTIPTWDETKGWFDITFCTIDLQSLTSCVSDGLSINPDPNCCINLNAQIYFDLQPAVTTNMSTTCMACTNEQKISKVELCDQSLGNRSLLKHSKTFRSDEVSPNPALTSISLNLNSEIVNANVIIFNSLGAIVKSVNYSYLANDTQIDVQDLVSGFYKIAIKGNDEVLEFKFVKL
jgi:uncharacterized repeat protein (TIGR01451 family)